MIATQKYPVGLQDFKKIREQNYVYVDKTMYISGMANKGGYYFLSRPRRFGKSLLLSSMYYLFRGEEQLFNSLFIKDKWDFSTTFPVVKISFAEISFDTKGLSKSLNEILAEIADEHQVVLESEEYNAQFRELIRRLNAKYRQKVVILIDEYDKPVIHYLGVDTPTAIKNRDILKNFYSIMKDADPYLHMVFITGVSKFSKMSIFSDLNNLKDITLNEKFNAVCGITQQELDACFANELQHCNINDVRDWYDGYTWNLDSRLRIYNPFSILNFFDDNYNFKNYWFETGTPTFLVNLSRELRLYDLEDVETSADMLASFNLENIDLLSLMFQTGYLAIKEYNPRFRSYKLSYPNKEVKESYVNNLLTAFAQNRRNPSAMIMQNIEKALIQENPELLKESINAAFSGIPYEIWQNDNEHFYHAIVHLLFTLMGVYINSQVQSRDGRLDALIQTDKAIFCLEFKLNQTAEAALQQIKDRDYLLPYQNSGRRLHAIGINFSGKTKQVEKVLWEKLG